MACIELTMYSHILQMETMVNVLLPEKKHVLEVAHPNKRYPVLYVLHGYGDTYNSWMRKSMLETIAREYELIVVMPDARNSFYTTMVSGLDFETFLVEELPIKMVNFFPISMKKKDTYIMGNSMGGYGAFKIAMKNPDKYEAAVSFSGVLGLRMSESYLLMKDDGFKKSFALAFGTSKEFEESNQNLYRCAHQLHSYQGEIPRFYHICGIKDELAYTMGLEFINYVSSHDLFDIKYEEIQDGEHDWNTWNGYIKKALEFLLHSEQDSK